MEQPPSQALRRILVPLDGSFFAEQALSYAQMVGEQDTELILLEVVPPAEELRGLFGKLLVTAHEVKRVYDDGIEKGLAHARQVWLGNRGNVRLEVATGDPAEEILRTAVQHQVDLIVMASHGRSALGRWAIGSVADRVARTSLVPVMLIRPREEMPTEPGTRTIERLIVPLDGSAVSAQALPFAERLAVSMAVPVLLVTVVDVARELSGVLVYGAAFSREVYDEVVAGARAKARRDLADAMTNLSRAGVAASEQILDGQVAETIANLAGPHDAIVMTSHGRSGLRRWVMGSVAEKLVREGPVPVVLVPSAIRREVVEPASREVFAPAPTALGAAT
jgi:nucleotide-binding universal stress UspA family protein